MWTRADLKRNGKIAFKRNYWVCVLVSLLAVTIGGWTNTVTLNFSSEDMQATYNQFATYGSAHAIMGWQDFFALFVVVMSYLLAFVVAFCLLIFAGNLATMGSCRYFMENREHKTPFSRMFYGFTGGRYNNCMTTMLVRWLIVFGYSLLLIIPGIIKSYSYMLVPYILAENPHINRKRALQLSKEMMKGHKWEAFVFKFSFFWWILLGAFTGGLLNIFWVEPYIAASFAEYYTALKSEAIYKGLTNRTELPGVVQYEETTEEVTHEVAEEVIEEC